ncbi:MAG: iron-containing alcohol dehydrogenase [Candidatus Syntrophoarchaeum sp.]|nr:iron-containing alcohol dehydrogenase [Methanomicrobia archaeon]MBL7117884.1 iron-containing alcohol dehydrogenase [Candidatus Syntrophoarchaeum sp.]
MGTYAVQLPKRVVFGDGVEEKIGAEAKGLGAKKALIVTDATIEKAGLLEKVEKTLKEAVEVNVFDIVESEPTLAAAETVAGAARAAKYDLIVGVGGGSVMDMAKVASAAASNPGQGVSEFMGANKIANPSVPKILVPTTAGTGAEATPFTLIIVEGKKKAIASPYNLADVVLISPSFTATMPAKVTASTGMDALSHAIEAFLSTGSNPLTDSFALEAIRKIADNLEVAFSHGDNLDARLKMSLAAMLGGMAFGNAGVIVGHAAAHTFGAKYKIPHGVAAALALPYIMEYNAPVARDKLVKVAREMGEDVSKLTEEEAASRAVARVRGLLEKLELPTRLADLDVPEEDLQELAEAMSKEKGYLARNPRKIEHEDAVKIFERLWSGE